MLEQIRLTQFSHGGGWGCKLGPGDLKTVLKNLPTVHHEQFLLGFNSSDDAAVTQLRPDLAVVQSLDFFMPIVDDPYTFGMIAAATT